MKPQGTHGPSQLMSILCPFQVFLTLAKTYLDATFQSCLGAGGTHAQGKGHLWLSCHPWETLWELVETLLTGSSISISVFPRLSAWTCFM